MNTDFEATKVLQDQVENLTKTAKEFHSQATAASSAASTANNKYKTLVEPKFADFEKRINALEKKK